MRRAAARTSPVARDAHLLAHVEHRAGRALGELSSADVLPERNQQAIDLDPVALRQGLLERSERLFGDFRLHDAPTV